MNENAWLLLLHQIPPQPAYFRAQVLRRLSQVGALPVKNSAYLLPNQEETREDFEWIAKEIERQGGSAWLFGTEVLSGMTASEIEESFRRLRAVDYEALVADADAALTAMTIEEAASTLPKLTERLGRLKAIDFFVNPLRGRAEERLKDLAHRLSPEEPKAERNLERGRTWVTRAGVKVDRIGSAWLVRRFLDPEATFRFVDPRRYEHAGDELRFDMFEGEYTHEGDLCTFEVVVQRHALEHEHPGLKSLAEMVHDIDLKENRYRRPETAGLARMIDGLCARISDDDERLRQGGLLFDSLLEGFSD